MARNKQKKLDEVASLANVFDQPEGMKGLWASQYFKNDQPIVLELACGGGEYTLALAEKYPEKNFIGMDKKGNRIWRAAKKALRAELATGTAGSFNENSLHNVAFVRGLIEKLGDFFAAGEVAEIWITFPDPQPKPCKAEQRLVSGRFLNVYSQVLAEGGALHLKTDSDLLFDYALDVLKERNIEPEELIWDVHGTEVAEVLGIRTFYEQKFSALGFKIKYLRFRLRRS